MYIWKFIPKLILIFSSKHISSFNKLQKENSQIRFDLTKEKGILYLRNLPEVVSVVKDTVLSLAIQKLARKIFRKETALIVGKGGTIINQVVSNFDDKITVNKLNNDKCKLEIIGKIESVQESLAKICVFF